MAISTALTKLYSAPIATPTVFTQVVDIVTYPDMGSAPSKLDTTTLSAEKMKTFILGLQDSPDLTFECNYDETKFSTILNMTGLFVFKVELGTAGADGIFTWQGHISVMKNGGGVDEVRKMTITLSAETEIVFS